MTFQDLTPDFFPTAKVAVGADGKDVWVLIDRFGGEHRLQELLMDCLGSSPYSKAVLDMRNKQRHYFKTKTGLTDSFQAERTVDKYLEKFKVKADA